MLFTEGSGSRRNSYNVAMFDLEEANSTRISKLFSGNVDVVCSL